MIDQKMMKITIEINPEKQNKILKDIKIKKKELKQENQEELVKIKEATINKENN